MQDKAAVYKHIPDYFPEDVGVVGYSEVQAGDDTIMQPLISWNENFSTGCDEIDRQHKHMMCLCQPLHSPQK